MASRASRPGPQIDVLKRGARHLPAGCAVLLVHGINPHGFAWWRRTTEEGVDLIATSSTSRSHCHPTPATANCRCLRHPDLDEATLLAAEGRMADYRARHGEAAYLTARGSGQ